MNNPRFENNRFTCSAAMERFDRELSPPSEEQAVNRPNNMSVLEIHYGPRPPNCFNWHDREGTDLNVLTAGQQNHGDNYVFQIVISP